MTAKDLQDEEKNKV